jgi:hypothetical protein
MPLAAMATHAAALLHIVNPVLKCRTTVWTARDRLAAATKPVPTPSLHSDPVTRCYRRQHAAAPGWQLTVHAVRKHMAAVAHEAMMACFAAINGTCMGSGFTYILFIPCTYARIQGTQ